MLTVVERQLKYQVSNTISNDKHQNTISMMKLKPISIMNDDESRSLVDENESSSRLDADIS